MQRIESTEEAEPQSELPKVHVSDSEGSDEENVDFKAALMYGSSAPSFSYYFSKKYNTNSVMHWILYVRQYFWAVAVLTLIIVLTLLILFLHPVNLGLVCNPYLPCVNTKRSYFYITLLDEQTKIPLQGATMRTVNQITFNTDDQGSILFYEPGLMNRTIVVEIEAEDHNTKHNHPIMPVKNEAACVVLEKKKSSLPFPLDWLVDNPWIPVTIPKIPEREGIPAGGRGLLQLSNARERKCLPVASDYAAVNVLTMGHSAIPNAYMVDISTGSPKIFFGDSSGLIIVNDPAILNEELDVHVYTLSEANYTICRVYFLTGSITNCHVQETLSNVALLLFRTTGEGIFNNKFLLGKPTSMSNPVDTADIMSVQTTIAGVYHRGEMYWFWGGIKLSISSVEEFWPTSARHSLTNLDIPSDFEFYTKESRARSVFHTEISKMAEIEIIFVTSLPKEKIGYFNLTCVFGYSFKEDEGFHTSADEEKIAVGVWNETTSIFDIVNKSAAVWPTDSFIFDSVNITRTTNRFKGFSPFTVLQRGIYLYLCMPMPLYRAPLNLASVFDHINFEAFTPIVQDGRIDYSRDSLSFLEGKLNYEWRSNTSVLDPLGEFAYSEMGLLNCSSESCLFHQMDVMTGERLVLGFGSTFWHEFSELFIMVASKLEISQDGSLASPARDVYIAIAPTLYGPWHYCQKIYTFELFNVHHINILHEGWSNSTLLFEGILQNNSNSFGGVAGSMPRMNNNTYRFSLNMQHPELLLPIPFLVTPYGNTSLFYGNVSSFARGESVEDQGINEDPRFYGISQNAYGSNPLFECTCASVSGSILSISNMSGCACDDITSCFLTKSEIHSDLELVALRQYWNTNNSLSMPFYAYGVGEQASGYIPFNTTAFLCYVLPSPH